MFVMEEHPTPRVPADSFGNRLRLVRAECGYNAEQLAALCGVTDRAYYGWEQGASPRNMATVVNRICEATGYDRNWLMFGGPLDASRNRCFLETCTSDYVPLRFVFDESELGITQPPALYERFVTVADGWHS